jgi:hypothetical protein
MLDTGVVAVVVEVADEAVVSLVLSFVCCSLLLHDANETNSAPSIGAKMFRTEIIVVCFKN